MHMHISRIESSISPRAFNAGIGDGMFYFLQEGEDVCFSHTIFANLQKKHTQTKLQGSQHQGIWSSGYKKAISAHS